MQLPTFRRATMTTMVAASLLLSSVAAMPAIAASATDKLNTLATAFYGARASFDPLYLATANGDGRYDDKLGITIAPSNRKKQFATYHKMQAQLRTIPRAQLNEDAQLNFDLLSFELDSTLN